jgi:UPF0271 protein
MIKENKVRAVDGSDIAIEGGSICVHSDTPGALEIVSAVRSGLEAAGLTVSSPTL